MLHKTLCFNTITLHIKWDKTIFGMRLKFIAQCSTGHPYPPSAHSAICLLVNGPCTSASSVFSHLYSHDTSVSLEEAELAPPTDDDEAEVEGSSMSANMSTGSAEYSERHQSKKNVEKGKAFHLICFCLSIEGEIALFMRGKETWITFLVLHRWIKCMCKTNRRGGSRRGSLVCQG